MRKTFLLALTCAMALVIAAAAQQGALQTAATTLGVANIKSIEFTGTGQMFSVGQNYVASDPWPPVPLKNYTATINYDTGAHARRSRPDDGTADAARRRCAVHRRPAPDPTGQRELRLEHAGAGRQRGRAGAPAPQAAPQAAAQVERMLALWATPQGFVKAAMANNATTPAGARRHGGVVHGWRQVQDGRHDQRTGTGRKGPDVDRSVDCRRHADRDRPTPATGTSAASCSRHASSRPRTATRRWT